MADINIQMHKKNSNGTYDNIFPKANASFISTSDGSNVQAKLDLDNKISTYIHSKSGTVHTLTLTGGGNNIEFLATADYVAGDTFVINGITITSATTSDGEALTDGLFKNGNYITGIRLNGTKLGFKSAGGGVKYNVFCQPTEPPTKQGVWLKTATIEALKKIVFDTSPYAAESWQPTSQIANLPALFRDASSCVYQNEAFIFSGQSVSDKQLNTAYAYNFSTNTYRNLRNIPIAFNNSPSCVPYNGKIYLFGVRYESSSFVSYTYAYDIASDTYTVLAKMPSAANGISPIYYNGEIFLFGGTTSGGGTGNSYYAYKISTNTYRGISKPTQTDTTTGGEWYNMTNTNGAVMYGNKAYIFCNYSLVVSYDFSNGTYSTSLAHQPNTKGGIRNPFVVGSEIFMMGCNDYNTGSNAANYAYNIIANTYRLLATKPTVKAMYCPIFCNGIIGLFGGSIQTDQTDYNAATYVANVDCMSLTAKQYPDNPTAVIYRQPKDTTNIASFITSKLCDYLPTYFKDAMFFKDGNLLSPELYTGDGTIWTKIREAQ